MILHWKLFERIRKLTKSFTYRHSQRCNAHKTDGSRIHKQVENWYEWCTNSDTVQMNEFEIATLSRDKLSEYRMRKRFFTTEIMKSKV
ncbi:MAG: hypothetical protein IPL16_15455 [Ignavibacteria bacterium]|nr:hypothetical protein [Ignavibacteria bacterium]